MALSRYQQAASGFMPINSAPRGRGRTQELVGDTTIRPVARPTDPFVQVGPTPKSPLWDVARALGEFESSLQPLVNKAQAEHNAAEAARGEAAFYENNQQGMAEAVRTGAVPAYASPQFKQSYREAEGRRIARDATASIVAEYETWPGKASDDTTGFAPWISERTRSFLEGIDDPVVLQSAMPGIRQITERLGLQHAKYVGDRVMDRAVDGIGKDIQGAIDNASGEPVPGPDGKLITYSGLSEAITASVEAGRKIGIPEERLRKIAVDATVAKAVAKRDFDLLKALPPELASTPYGAKEIAEAQDKIATAIYRDESRADRRTNIEEKDARETAIRAVIERFTQDIDAEIPDEILAAGEKGDPEFRIKAEELRNKMRTNATKVDPQREIDASVRIHTAEDPLAQAQKEIEAGNIGNPSRVNSMLYTANRLKQSRDRGAKSIISTPAVKQFEEAIREQYTTDDPLLPRVTDEAAYGSALVDYHIALTEWEEANPNASTIERMKAAREIGDEMLKARPTTKAAPVTRSAPSPAPKAQQEAPQQTAPVQGPDPLLEEIRRANPALKNLPDDVIRKYLPQKRSDAGGAKKASFESYGGTPFAVPTHGDDVAAANTYTGPTYEPEDPSDKFEAEGLDIAYAAEPGSQYGRKASASAQPFVGLVFHHTGANVPANRQVAYGQRVDTKRGGQFGYHFYIDTEGNIIQGAPMSKRTNHLQPWTSGLRIGGRGLENENTVSVSLAGDGRNPTPAQMAAARKLGAALSRSYSIPSNHIFGHGELQKSREATEGLDLATSLRTDKEG